VRHFLYPALLKLPDQLDLSNQFAYRPTGSTTAALIALLQEITTLLKTNAFVHCFSFDYSKAFDTLSHSSLATRLADLDIPDNVHNWILSYLYPRTHVTAHGGVTSSPLPISAGIVQGSVLGPTLFNLNSASLRPLHAANKYFKYADDSYLLVASSNVSTVASELAHHASWAASANLKLNPLKTMEIVFASKKKGLPAPPPTPGVNRVTTLKILGVMVDKDLDFNSQIDSTLTFSVQSLFALNTLRQHGLCDRGIQMVFTSVVISRLLYAAPAYWGFLSAHNRGRLEAYLSRAIKYGYYSERGEPLASIEEKAEQRLFNTILDNPNHVLHPYLPPTKTVPYLFRKRSHTRILPHKDDRNFLSRLLYSDIY